MLQILNNRLNMGPMRKNHQVSNMSGVTQ